MASLYYASYWLYKLIEWDLDKIYNYGYTEKIKETTYAIMITIVDIDNSR